MTPDLAHWLRPGTLQLTALPPLSLYIHLPWCLKKCPYCDFNSHAWQGQDLQAVETRYLDAIEADLDASLPLIWGRSVQTVFIGGGTPSLFSVSAIDRLLTTIRARLRLVADAEITLEANPGTFEKDRFRAFRQAGITRLSIGVQSFNDRLLHALGRVHDAAQARAAVQEAAQYFEHYNIDLMYALPGQTESELGSDLDTALSYQPPHLSVYHLSLEPNTIFSKHPPPGLPDDDTAYAMLDQITERTRQAGLDRYEVSAYARDGYRCRHNLNYWQFGDYLGLGAGAHGKISFAHRIVRTVKWRDPERYMLASTAGQALAHTTEVRRADLPFEFMLNALRLRQGVAQNLYTERTGLAPNSLLPAVQQAEQKGLLLCQDNKFVPTALGYNFLNELQALFLVD